MNQLLLIAASKGAAPSVVWGVSSPVMWAIDAGIVVMVIGLLCCLWRLARGPHLVDRAIAVDTVGILLVGIVGLFTVKLQTLAFLDAVLVLSLLSFAGTVALAQYIARPYRNRHAAGDTEVSAQPRAGASSE
jgi:multisubunit Na+/H+ antiporter MnhF subunit